MFDYIEHSVAYTARLPICKIRNAILIVEHRVVYSARNFAKPSFSNVRNFETQVCEWYGIKRIKFIFVDKGNSETRFEPPLYYFK